MVIGQPMTLSDFVIGADKKQHLEDFNYNFSQRRAVISKNKHFLLSSSPTGLSLAMIL